MTTELKRTRTAPEKSPEHAQNDQRLSRTRSTPEDDANNRLFPPRFVSFSYLPLRRMPRRFQQDRRRQIILAIESSSCGG